MNKTSNVLWILVMILLSSGIVFAAPIELVVNGGFETGDLTGWDITVNVDVQSDNVYEGTYAAGLSVSEVSKKIFYKDSNPYSALLIQELAGYEATDQIFNASFMYNVDVLRDYCGSDKLYVGFLSVAGDNWFDVRIYGDAELVVAGDSYGWQEYTPQIPIDLSGESINKLYLGFYYADVFLSGGNLDMSSAFLDNISVTANSAPVPEPATLLLLGTGLLGAAGLRRRNRG